jgi:ABC-2 type transport system ATP-binding protein
VLFIDEPLMGLDPYTIRLIKDLLVSKARGGMTIFLTTHILALAQDIADRIGIIMEGRMVALGTLQELLDLNGGKDLEEVFLKLTVGGMRDRPMIDA